MIAPTWPAITTAAASLRTIGTVYGYLAAALEHDHASLNPERNAPMTKYETKDETK